MTISHILPTSALLVGGLLFLSGCVPSLQNSDVDVSNIVNDAAETVEESNEATAERMGVDVEGNPIAVSDEVPLTIHDVMDDTDDGANTDEADVPVVDVDLETVNDKNTYTNTYYNFQVILPEGTEYCLNDFCENSADDKDMQHFKVSYGSDLGLSYLEIRPLKNELGMTAVEFGKRLLELNEQYDNPIDFYSDAEEIMFAGEPAYRFLATGGFEERGLSTLPSGDVYAATDSDEFIEVAGEGVLLAEPHYVMYFDHNGTMYRVLYPQKQYRAEQIIDSFVFSD